MEANKIEVAPWVKEMLAAGHETFYRSDNGRLSYYDPARKTYVADPVDQRKIELRGLKAAGRVVRENEELFNEESWIQVLIGQGLVPRGYDPLVAIKSDPQIEQITADAACDRGLSCVL